MTETNTPRRTAKSAPAAAKNTDIDTALIANLAHLLQDTELSEIEVQKGDLRIRVARQSHTVINQTVSEPVVSAAPRAAAAAPAPTPAPAKSDANAVPAPMVGTAYRRASPGSKAFVEVGSKVSIGDKILLIEAMKTFNDILAPHAGTVTAIMIDDGQPVEYGQPLMVIE
ncbi:MAG: acetyl-CoA carboxylase biotin carboxyl carrier protein [Hyphomicrobiales bacterium]|nr:acetyl-CoA carboxylase biotin carboxyl carrier protein [Hyphomicrobiales bacterium]MDE2113926.1 acetyl-CoA carboxylase biotin carboxyl carrier protein [Hyphomicrobiales bacterium]